MLFLQRAKLLPVLSVNPRQSDNIDGFDISNQIARHGGNAEAVRTVSGDVSVGDFLFSEAADLGADMIVISACGHSRLREFILGSVSRHIFECMTVPVFMSHRNKPTAAFRRISGGDDIHLVW